MVPPVTALAAGALATGALAAAELAAADGAVVALELQAARTSALVMNTDRALSDRFIDHLHRGPSPAAHRGRQADGYDDKAPSARSRSPPLPVRVEALSGSPPSGNAEARSLRPDALRRPQVAVGRRHRMARRHSDGSLGLGPVHCQRPASSDPTTASTTARTRRPMAAASDGGNQLLSCSTISQPA